MCASPRAHMSEILSQGYCKPTTATEVGLGLMYRNRRGFSLPAQDILRLETKTGATIPRALAMLFRRHRISIDGVGGRERCAH